VVDVLFDRPRELELQHRTPDRAYRLATVAATEEQATPLLAGQFEAPHRAPELKAERQGSTPGWLPRRIRRWR
jgi:hypothetical protein